MLVLLASLAAGCATKYTFEVDAIHQSSDTLPRVSYRLVDARPGSQPGSAAFARVARDVHTALSSKGLFAAPEGTVAELAIEVDFGMSAPIVEQATRREPVYVMMPMSYTGGIRPVDGAMTAGAQPRHVGDREFTYTITTYRKFLRLTARENEPTGAGETARQVWSVLVTNEDESDNLNGYTRLMVAAAMDHVSEDIATERRVVLTRRDGRVTFVEQGVGSS